MGLPNIKDLVMYVNKALTGNDWNTNWQKIINWLTGGDTDINVKSITVSQGGGITNNGTLTQSGNLSVGGNISATGNLNIDGVISGNGSGLTGVVSAATIAYTPFCVNSGNLDANGNGDLFDYDAGVSTSIEFKVDDSKPITFTNAKGKPTTLTAINSYDLSQTDNGTYIVFITENATAVTLTSNGSKVFRQPYAPISDPSDPNYQNPQPLDIWLDTSCEGLKSYIRQSGSWEENNLVILGEITISNHTVSSAKTYAFNQNGYNVNFLTPTFGITPYAIEHLVDITSEAKNTVHGKTEVPTLIITETYAIAGTFRVEVSVDGTNWQSVIRWNVNYDDNRVDSNSATVIIDKGLYFRVSEKNEQATNQYIAYAPLY